MPNHDPNPNAVRLRLLAAVIATIAGVSAVIIAIELIRTALA